MSELKKCPCCNGEAKLVKKDEMVGHGSSTTLVYVKCTECGLRTAPHDTYLEGTEAVVKAIEEWNKRTKTGDVEKEVQLATYLFSKYYDDRHTEDKIRAEYKFPEAPKGD